MTSHRRPSSARAIFEDRRANHNPARSDGGNASGWNSCPAGSQQDALGHGVAQHISEGSRLLDDGLRCRGQPHRLCDRQHQYTARTVAIEADLR